MNFVKPQEVSLSLKGNQSATSTTEDNSLETLVKVFEARAVVCVVTIVVSGELMQQLLADSLNRQHLIDGQ